MKYKEKKREENKTYINTFAFECLFLEKNE